MKRERKLLQMQIEEAELDARLLLEYVCATDRNTLLAHGDKDINELDCQKYLKYIEKRGQHIPLQHLTREQEFMGLRFAVDENVLIPRQDTEVLVEEVLRNLHDGMKILDMCTGSGCILLSLLNYSNDTKGTGVDISKKALKIAKQNAEQLQIQAEFVESNLFEGVSDKYDIIVSNPPYIRSEVISTLMLEVREHEPLLALDGMEDGLFFYRQIIQNAKLHLLRGAMLFFEIGFDQGADVSAIMKKENYKDVRVIKDFAGLDRVVYGTFLEE